jgi:dihydrodipicolinate synthase/N-acetylneuraminate lyase
MAVEQFHGILAAVVTPFTADGSALDEAGIARQVEHILGNGVHGLVPGGSTGEFTSLTNEERKRSASLYIEAAAGRGPVIVGTGALTTAETVELSKHANAAGASGVMVVPPFYDAQSFDDLLAHYTAVSDAIDIPIMYYHLPSNTGVDLTPDQFSELAAKTRVTCFKNTSDNAVKLTEILLSRADDIQAINGYDTLTFLGLASGAKASVWGAASVIPALAAELYQALAVDNDIVKGRELWAKIWPICDFMEQHNYAGIIKAGVELVGAPAGPARLPVQPIAPEYIAQYRGLLTAAGVELA